jgi:hypothetical protein
MPGARTARPHSMHSMLIFSYSEIVQRLFALRAQCGRDALPALRYLKATADDPDPDS